MYLFNVGGRGGFMNFEYFLPHRHIIRIGEPVTNLRMNGPSASHMKTVQKQGKEIARQIAPSLGN